ncbi:MAG: methyltransferase domain-containing protein [Desulfobacterales bacterium]|jgi:ubiquinone/menaquinone biosynthesis C-methylase UbiE
MGGHICPWWVAYTFDNRLRNLFHQPEKILAEYVARGMTVLDVGCGMGFFTIGLARIVSDKGCVIAADVQEKMLATLQKRSEKAGLAGIIRPHKSEPNHLGISTLVDFILAFWMVHEVLEPEAIFRQMVECLKPDGKMLIAEPRFHVSSKRFREIVAFAQASGLTLYESPAIKFSRSAVFNHKAS